MGDKWFIKKEDGVFGPVSADDLQNLIKNGRITLDQEASQNETGPWEPLKSYDLFKERPLPIEEMFEDEDESIPDENTEATLNGFDKKLIPDNALIALAKNQHPYRAWGINLVSAIVAIAAFAILGKNDRSPGVEVFHLLLCVGVGFFGVRNTYYYFITKKLLNLPAKTLRKMWLELGGFGGK